VHINGRCVGIHRGGYDPFSFDITACLNDNGNQEIILEVWDPGNEMAVATGKQSNDRFSDPHGYSYCPSSGVWQTVWLEPVPEISIADIKIVPNLDEGRVSVHVIPSRPDAGTTVEAVVREGGQTIGREPGKCFDELVIMVPNPRPWSPQSLFLYDLDISIKDASGTVDQVSSYFGMRKISLGKVKGLRRIFLNNAFLFQIGPLDQGFWPDGLYTAPPDDALRWDISMMKEFGYNMVRKHVKVEPQRWYYWCDKLGLLVWQDMPGTWGTRSEEEKTQFEMELDRMVRTHWNHPCIIDWVVFNEHWGLYDTERHAGKVMMLDPSRLVTGNSGVDAGRPEIDYEVGHIVDNHSYRPPAYPFASDLRANVCGEYGAIGYKVNDHIWDPGGPWVHDTYRNADEATAEYERFVQMLIKFQENGLSAAVYTQWTDVENEMNGIYTYDRKVVKLHKNRVLKANRSTYEGAVSIPTKGGH